MSDNGKCSRYQTVLCTDSIQGGCVPRPHNKKILFLYQGALYELSLYHLNVSSYRGVYRDVMGDII